MERKQKSHHGDTGVRSFLKRLCALGGRSVVLSKLRWVMIVLGIVLLILACSTTLVSAQDDEGCDPFEGGEPQSSKNCPCSTEPNSRYYCASAVQYTVFEITEKVRALFLSILETIARGLWLAVRFIANLAEAMLRGQVWQAIREGMLEQLQSVMGGPGGVLARVTGGGNGLFLIAMLLAGLVMVFPLLGASRLVQPDRVILWGVVLFALFIGGTQGFDLTNAVESLRVHLIEAIAEGDTGDGLIDLVALPVGATPEEARQLDTDDLMILPQVMLQSHFIGLPEGSRCQGEGGGADECQKYRVIAFETNIAGQDLEYMFAAVKYKPNVIESRQKQYTSGVVRMVVTLLAALVLLLFGIVFALLTAASLVLIIFFVAMLPLGFFEFGGVVLSGLMRQYTSVVGLSLFAAVMVRLMGGVTETIFGAVSDFSDVLGLLTYLGMLLIVGLGLQMAVRTAWGLMDGTFTVLRASVQMVGSMAYAVGGGPLSGITHRGAGSAKAASSAAPNTAVKAAIASGAELGMAFIDGTGGLPSDAKNRNLVVDVNATPSHANLGTQVFTTTERGSSGRDTISSLVPVGEREPEKIWAGSQTSMYSESSRNYPRWGVIGRDSYLPVDLNTLIAAEQAYFERYDASQTRMALERAFGSCVMADEVLGAYEIQGQAGAKRVRRVVEITLATVADLEQRGRTIIDDRGGLTPDCESVLLQNLRQAGLYDETDLHESAFIRRLAGVVIRSPVEVWNDPQASQILSRSTFDLQNTEAQVNDLPAKVRLQEVVKGMGWDEGKLTCAFSTLLNAEHRAAREGQPVVDCLLNEWQANTQFSGEDETRLREAARLMVLVGSQAKVHKSHPMPTEQADLIPPTAAIRREANGLAIHSPYSARLMKQFKEHLPAQDYQWDVDRAEWQISPGHEGVVQRILYEVAKENGWRVEDDQHEENVSDVPVPDIPVAAPLPEKSST